MDPANASQNVASRFARSGVLLDRLLHDLKQPLNYARLLAQDVRIDARKHRLDVSSVPSSMQEIEAAVDELVVMIDRLRCFAMPHAGSVATGVEVAEICEAATARIRGSSEDVSILQTSAPNLPKATADPGGLEHALWEILDNGSRAARDNGNAPGFVEVSTFARDALIVVSVRDNGPGISPDWHAEIFEPFFSTREGAAGLGLPLARALVAQSGGRVELVSSDAGGSLFEILLPAGTS